jgi:hypothetical protein
MGIESGQGGYEKIWHFSEALKEVLEERSVFAEVKAVTSHCQCLNELINYDEGTDCVEKTLTMILNVGMGEGGVEDGELAWMGYARTIQQRRGMRRWLEYDLYGEGLDKWCQYLYR